MTESQTAAALSLLIIQFFGFATKAVLSWIASRKTKKETIEKEKKDQDFKVRILSDISKYRETLNLTQQKFKVVLKEVTDYRSSNKELINSVSFIKDELTYTKEVKLFIPHMERYYLALIMSKERLRENEELTQFLKTVFSNLVEIFYKVIDLGFEEIDYTNIQNDFDRKEFKLRSTFKCDNIKIIMKKIEKSLNDERDDFLFNMPYMLKNYENGDRPTEFKKLCKAFIATIVSKANTL